MQLAKKESYAGEVQYANQKILRRISEQPKEFETATAVRSAAVVLRDE